MTPDSMAPDVRQAIIAAVQDGFARQVEFLSEFTAIRSRRTHEGAALDFMAAALRARGWDVDDWSVPTQSLCDEPGFVDCAGEVANVRSVVGTLAGTDAGRSLILQGHVDVVPEGRDAMWQTPPFAPIVQDGWMHGRGAGDMKAGKVAALFAVEALRRAGYAPKGRLHYQSAIEEESSGLGAVAVLARGYRADCAFIPEPTGLALVRAQVGALWFRLKVRGRPAHVAYAGTGSSAITAAMHLVRALQGMEAAWNAEAATHPWYKGVAHPLTFNAGQIRGGDWASSLPAWCDVDCRMGVLPGDDVAARKAQIEAVVADASAKHPFLRDTPPEIEWHGFQADGYVLEGGEAPEAALRAAHEAALRAAHEAAIGAPGPDDEIWTALTDTRFYGLYHGIPALCYGPKAESIHGFDERVELASVQRCTEVIALFIAEWCGLRSL